jgi:dienelactone hydrolase
MLRRQALAMIVSLGLAAVTIQLLPLHGQTTGWRDTFSPSTPTLTGPHQVGTRRALLTDTSRQDPWTPDKPRELMVDVHYPAVRKSLPLEHYYRSNAATELGILEWAPAEEERLGLVTDEVNWLYRTHAHEWAPVADGRFPVLIVSADPGRLRTSYRSLAEELGSHGYVVISIDHPYDSAVVEFFPKRRVVEPEDAGVDVPRDVADETRSKDIEYVAAHLAEVDPEVAESVDQQRIGLLGWVGAGTTQLARLRSVPGVRAIASLAALPPQVETTGAGPTPMLMITPSGTHSRPVRGGWRALVSVAGSTDRGLTDEGLVLAQIATAYPRVANAVRTEIGTAPATTVPDVVHKYVRAFFDTHLRDRDDAVFNDPAPAGTTVDVLR